MSIRIDPPEPLPGLPRGISREIEIEERPLLTRAREIELGHRLQLGLARLARLLKRHPVALAAILDLLASATPARALTYRWVLERPGLREQAERARELVREALELERSNRAVFRRALAAAIEVAEPFPLEPETAVRLASDVIQGVTRPTPFETHGAAARKEALLGRLLERVTVTRNRLSLSNTLLVLNEVSRYEPRGMGRTDLFQEGFLGLQRAALRYDPGRNLRFSTYATYWIRQSILHAVLERGTLVRVPLYTQRKLRRRNRGLRVDLRHEEAERVRRVMNTLSLFPSERTRDDNSGVVKSLEPVAPQEGEPLAEEIAREIARALAKLKPRHALVLELRFGLDGEPGRTLEAISSLIGVSRERVRQIEREALLALEKSGELREVYAALIEREQAR